jgi:tetratricopeptide (TPR) repeat protein
MKSRLVPLLALAAVAFTAAVVAHPGTVSARGAAPTPSASPTPAASPTATPEPLEKAIPRLEARLKTAPDDKQAASELAIDYLQIQRPDLAIALTQRLLASGTKTAQVYYYDGIAQNALGHTKESMSDLENAANLEPTNAGVLGMLTNAYLTQNRPQDAERVAKRAVTFNPKDVNALMAYGNVLAAEKKYDQSRAQFELAAAADPKDVRPILAEAQTYQQDNAIALADGLFDRALAIDPNNVSALVGKARLESAQHNVKDAIATFERILPLETDPADKVAVIDQEAILYATEKMDTDAVATYRKAIDGFPNVPSAHTAYAEYLYVKKDNAGAEREWIAGEGPNRDQADAIVRLGQFYAGQNNIPKAIDQFKRLTEVDANDPRSHLFLAASYAASHQFDKARAEYKASYNLQHTPDALLGLGQTDIALRNYPESAQVYDALDKGAPDLSRRNPTILYGLGLSYQRMNQPQKARAAYAKLLGYVPSGSQAAGELRSLISAIDHPPSAKKSTAVAKKPAPKATAKPKG